MFRYASILYVQSHSVFRSLRILLYLLKMSSKCLQNIILLLITKIELLEKLNNILSPFGLAKRLAGLGIYEKRIALQYPLPAPYIIAAVVWAAVLFVLFRGFRRKENRNM